ncbi:hypothetical protein Scep_001119 [Stephania cephalantha]|uniref:procollagen-proline 4-dioxygenase n=1 Tax=Stephania cephalantha TaxID=152367 RepID=A0AAP0L7E0_9MAGN
MKPKTKSGGFGQSAKLGLPIVFCICSLFFFAGFFGSWLLNNDIPVASGRPRSRILASVAVEEPEFQAVSNGETGESSATSISSQILSWKPLAIYFPGFASPKQCEKIIEMTKENLEPSTLALRSGETTENTKGIRTSSGTFISSSDDQTGTLGLIEQKIAKVTSIPASHGEAFNVLRYEIGQRYMSHYDAFHATEYGPQKSQRVASFLLYLSDVEEGGETMFPYENGLNMDDTYDPKKCVGLKVKPRQGDGLLFYSLYPNGTIDPLSLHGSCPVIKGEKWVATKWIRDEVFY